MRFLITMHMPSSNGFLVHQVIFDHESETMDQLYTSLNNDIFIIGRQFYKRTNDEGESVFMDKGELILNTSHIGKVQKYIEYDNESENKPVQKQRPPIRGRNIY